MSSAWSATREGLILRDMTSVGVAVANFPSSRRFGGSVLSWHLDAEMPGGFRSHDECVVSTELNLNLRASIVPAPVTSWSIAPRECPNHIQGPKSGATHVGPRAWTLGFARGPRRQGRSVGRGDATKLAVVAPTIDRDGDASPHSPSSSLIFGSKDCWAIAG